MQCFTPGCDAHFKASEVLANGRGIDGGHILTKMDYSYQLEGDLKFDSSKDTLFPDGTWQVTCDFKWYSSDLGFIKEDGSWSNPVSFELRSHGSINGNYPGSDDLYGQGKSAVGGYSKYTYDSSHQPIGVTGSALIPLIYDLQTGAINYACQAGIADWVNERYASIERASDGTLTATSFQEKIIPNYDPNGLPAMNDPEHTSATLTRSASFVGFTGNQPPVANAGPDLPASGSQPIKPGDIVTLKGSATDPDNDPLTFQWSQKDGSPTVKLNNANSETATFEAPVVDKETQLTFQFTATDDKGASDDDTAIVTLKAGDFSLTCAEMPSAILIDGSEQTTCKVTSIDGFNEPVKITCKPSDSDLSLTCTTNESPVTPPPNGVEEFILTVEPKSPLKVGIYPIEITGTGGEKTHSYKLTADCVKCLDENERKKAEEVDKKVTGIIDFGKNHDLPQFVKRMTHWREGSGNPLPLDTSFLRNQKTIQQAEEINENRFETNSKNEGQGSSLFKKISQMNKDGSTSGKFTDVWKKDITIPQEIQARDFDLAAAVGTTGLLSEGNFEITRKGDVFTIKGTVVNSLKDKFDFNPGDTFPIPTPPFSITSEELNLLEKCKDAKPFQQDGGWTMELNAVGTLKQLKDSNSPNWKWTLK